MPICVSKYLHNYDAGKKRCFPGHCIEPFRRRVTAPERIIQIFEFEGLPERGHVCLETATFESLPGDRTRVTGQSLFQSVADRDGMVQSGMEHGVIQSYERLDEILESQLVK